MRCTAAVAVALTGLLAGCTTGDDDATDVTTARSMPEGEDRIFPEGDEPTVLGPLGSSDSEFETEDGLVQIGSAEVPDTFADSFPIPDGVDVQLASQTGTQAGFSGVTDLTFVELVSFYETELPAAGYGVERSSFVDGVVAVFDFEGAD
ncbi:MAG TPA: hypothetical protein VK860_10100, partial [Ilumatobacteraceae bacterium]|nr:hypothetical protein [Ilumatobacteraceae bacterium]